MVKFRYACALLCIAQSMLGVAQPVRQPLDPLTTNERREAERIAMSDDRTRELLGAARNRLIYVEFVAPKPDGGPARGDPEIARHAEVVFYRYDDDTGVRALVDLRRNAVVEVLRVAGDTVPLTQGDLVEAVRLALANEDVRTLLGPNYSRYEVQSAPRTLSEDSVRALLVHATVDADPCWRRRCVQLFFRAPNGGYFVDSTIVDLRNNRVFIQRGLR